MGYLDIILFPLYVFIFHLFFAARRKKFKDPVLRFYHKYGFWVKVFSTIAITIFNLYLSVGDSTTLYYTEGHNIFKLILQDPAQAECLFSSGKDFSRNLIFDAGNQGYFSSEANFFIIRLVAIFSFFTFGRYLLINLFFSMIAFSGIWRLFRFFYELYPHLHKKLAVAVLFLPTVVFWSSGILKDPISMGMLGWMTYCIYYTFYKREEIFKNGLISIAAIWVLSTVKPYILFAFLPFFALYLLLSHLHLIKGVMSKLAMILLVSVVIIAGFILMSEKLQDEMGSFALEKIGESVQMQQKNFIGMSDRAESSFSLGREYDGSFSSLVRIAPLAINATLFRPYLWESKKISTLLSSLESLSLMLFTLFVLFKAGIWLFVSSIFKDPMVLFCFFFSIIFALFIGATTLNFGTLVRYKIPCMPFYIIALLLIQDKKMQQKHKPAAKNEAGV